MESVYIETTIVSYDNAAQERMERIGKFPILEATMEANSLTRAIVEAGAIPQQAIRDAAHTAIAAVNNVDYLLTWNCRHLANAQIIRAVVAICAAHGYAVPAICTPEELMGT